VRRQAGDALELRYLKEVLSRAEGNLSRAATIAGVSRQALSQLAVKHGIHPRNTLY
jgi:DNA-binding NtrC family response regulator